MHPLILLLELVTMGRRGKNSPEFSVFCPLWIMKGPLHFDGSYKGIHPCMISSSLWLLSRPQQIILPNDASLLSSVSQHELDFWSTFKEIINCMAGLVNFKHPPTEWKRLSANHHLSDHLWPVETRALKSVPYHASQRSCRMEFHPIAQKISFAQFPPFTDTFLSRHCYGRQSCSHILGREEEAKQVAPVYTCESELPFFHCLTSILPLSSPLLPDSCTAGARLHPPKQTSTCKIMLLIFFLTDVLKSVWTHVVKDFHLS